MFKIECPRLDSASGKYYYPFIGSPFVPTLTAMSLGHGPDSLNGVSPFVRVSKSKDGVEIITGLGRSKKNGIEPIVLSEGVPFVIKEKRKSFPLQLFYSRVCLLQPEISNPTNPEGFGRYHVGYFGYKEGRITYKESHTGHSEGPCNGYRVGDYDYREDYEKFSCADLMYPPNVDEVIKELKTRNIPYNLGGLEAAVITGNLKPSDFLADELFLRERRRTLGQRAAGLAMTVVPLALGIVPLINGDPSIGEIVGHKLFPLIASLEGVSLLTGVPAGFRSTGFSTSSRFREFPLRGGSDDGLLRLFGWILTAGINEFYVKGLNLLLNDRYDMIYPDSRRVTEGLGFPKPRDSFYHRKGSIEGTRNIYEGLK